MISFPLKILFNNLFRYAIFVELYADLDAAERHDEPVSTRLTVFKKITQHEEQVFGR